jgi:hypothetical protein
MITSLGLDTASIDTTALTDLNPSVCVSDHTQRRLEEGGTGTPWLMVDYTITTSNSSVHEEAVAGIGRFATDTTTSGPNGTSALEVLVTAFTNEIQAANMIVASGLEIPQDLATVGDLSACGVL